MAIEPAEGKLEHLPLAKIFAMELRRRGIECEW
jgi:hypothetical protein